MTDKAAAELEVRGDDVVARARAWLGTPYQHQASCRGAGTDCLGLLRGLWREFFGTEAESVPSYRSNWLESDGTDALLAAVRRHLDAIAVHELCCGDIAIFRTAQGGAAKHIGVLASSPAGHRTVIHAYLGYGVVETPLTPAWSRRMVAAFRFPRGRI